MSQRSLRDRLLLACQQGKSLHKMAEAERVSVAQVRRLTSRPAFQKQLAMTLVTKTLAQRVPSAKLERRTGRALARLVVLLESDAMLTFNAEDLAMLGAFSEQQYALGVAQLEQEHLHGRVKPS